MAMKTTDTPDPLLQRAADELRTETLPTWVSVSDKIITALRNTARQSTALDAHWPGTAHRTGDTVQVSDHVVRLAVVGAVSIDGAIPDRVVVHSDESRCTGVTLGIIAEYGVDIHELSDRLRAATAAAVGKTLGTPLAPDTVDIEITDVVLPEDENLT